MLRSYIILPLFVLLSFFGRASHIIGGDIYYDYLGNNQYRIYVAVYRDCASSGAEFDNPLHLGIFNSSNVRVDDVQVPLPGIVHLPVIFDNPCVTPPSGICNERAIYTVVLNLPPTPGGYTVAWQRCCRGPNVTNLDNPDDTGLTLATHITGTNSNAIVNSSPRFTNYPPLVICNNEDLHFNHSATDPDGDELRYELVTPYAGANSFNPQPIPIPTPNYPLVDWAGGYGPNNPLGPGSTTTIDPNTGQLFVDANLLGLYVVGIRVNEYRNGVLIGSTTRDFLFKVVNCVIQLSADVGSQEESPLFQSYCQGLTWTFDNQSYGGDTYEWDFGVPGTTTDVSTQFEPTFTYPSVGIYQVRLVVNPGWPCTDTAYMTLNLNNPLEVDFTYQDSMCFAGNTVDFTGQIIVGSPSTALTWDFGPDASIATATGLTVNGVHFSTGGGHNVKLTGTVGICVDSVIHQIYIHPDPVPTPGLPSNFQCEGLTQAFENNSQDASIFHWDFGVAGSTTDVSSEAEPTFTFPAPGTYTVTLTASIPEGCSNTTTQQYTFYEPLSVAFTHSDSLCITNNSFDFDGTVTGPPITTYSWNFGAGANPPTATTMDYNGVVYDNPGQIPVTLTASFLTCSKSASSTIYIFREPEINFGLKKGIQCAPFPAQFIDSSFSDTPIQYSWDFGDGATSTEQHPLHVYTTPGQYPVSLTITTDEGCASVLTLVKDNLINVRPTPVSKFDVSPKLTDICHSTISFTNQSEGALFYVYVFDEGNTASEETNPYFSYTTDGTHYPMLIVENEFGCSDSSMNSLFIEPYTVYIPNTFTPDSDEYNNTHIAVAALDAVEWEFRIYNRWGELVFLSYDQDAEWDGTYNGELAPSGTYTYALRYISCAGGERWEELTGHVNLLR